MRHLTLTLLTIAFLLFGHCSDDDDCFGSCPSGPFEADLKIKLTINDENPEVPVVVYKGRFENGDTLIFEVVNEGKVIYTLDADNYYSVTASYADGARQVIAINGGKMTLGSDECDCDSPENLTLNVRLAK